MTQQIASDHAAWSWWRRILFLMAMMMLILLCDRPAHAAGMNLGSVTVIYTYEDIRFPGQTVDCYQVETIDLANTDAVRSYMTELEKQAAEGKLQIYKTGTTDTEGMLLLTGMEDGMYFIPEQKIRTEEGSYTFESVLLTMPMTGEAGSIEYDVECYPKGEATGTPRTPGTPTTDTPTMPDTPSASGTPTMSNTSSTSGTPAKTGDSMPVILWAGLFLLAVFILIILMIFGRRRNALELFEDDMTDFDADRADLNRCEWNNYEAKDYRTKEHAVHLKKMMTIGLVILLAVSITAPAYASESSPADLSTVPAASTETIEAGTIEGGSAETETAETETAEAGTDGAGISEEILLEEADESETSGSEAVGSDAGESEAGAEISAELFSANMAVLNASTAMTVTKTNNNYLYLMSSADKAKLGTEPVGNYTLSNGYAAFSFKVNQLDPDGKTYVQKLDGDTASDQDFWNWCPDAYDGGSGYSWSYRYWYLHNELLLCVYYGYPNNLSGTDFIKRAQNTYGVPAEYAEDCVRLATQLAIWSITNETDFTAINNLRNADNSAYKSAYDPVFCLAGEIAKRAYDNSNTTPPIKLDLYRETLGETDSSGVLMLTTRTEDLSHQEVTPASAVLSASVILTGGTSGTETSGTGAALQAGDFSFSLKDTSGNVLETVTNDADGNVTFTALTYYLNGSHTYTIVQNAGTDDTINYDATQHTVSVAVTGSYTKTAAVTYDGGTDAPVFANTVKAGSLAAEPVTVSVTAMKTFDGEAPGEKRFTFVLYDQAGNEISRAQNDADGNIVFAPITYSKAGTYTYTINEVNDGQEGVVYDPKIVTATVKVSESLSEIDDLDLEGNYKKLDNNSYFYMKNTDTGVEYKVFCLNTQKASPSGQTFHATTDVSDALIQSAMTKPTAENLANVKKVLYYFNLHPEEYDDYVKQLILWQATGATNIGTTPQHGYVIPDELTKILGEITAIPQNFHTVYFETDAGDYQKLIYSYLTPEPEVTLSIETDGTTVFENLTKKETESSSGAVIKATKTLDGKNPGDKRFSFVLFDADGHEIQRTQNDSEGNITFRPITYTNPGTYTYTIKEVNDAQAGIVYDDRDLKVTVEVAETSSELDGQTVFGNKMTNVYNGEYFYMQDETTGDKYTVYCLNNQKMGPDGLNFTATQDVDDQTIQDAMANGTPERVERVKKVLYFFCLYPDRYTEYERQLIVWQAAGHNYNNEYVVQALCDIVGEVPDNFHVVYFDSGKEWYQNLIYGYLAPEPEITLSVSQGETLFANKTTSTTYLLPETGGTGTGPYCMAGLVIIVATAIYGYKFKYYERGKNN